MFYLYLFALLIGGGLLLFSLLGGSDQHDSDMGSHSGLDHHNPVQWLSLRALIYFLFVFGGVGAVLAKTWPAAAAPIVFVLAIGAGVGVGAAVSAAFNYLRKTDSGVRDGDDSFIGLAGRMSLAFGESGVGKVLVTRGDRAFELLARPLDKALGKPVQWNSVIIVEMVRGMAVVAPIDDPAARELASLNQP